MASPKAARRYAKALFDLAGEENKLDIVAGDLEGLGRLMAVSDDLKRFLQNYMIPLPRRIQVLGLLFEGQLDPLTFRFLVFIDEKQRIQFLPDMIAEYKRFHDEHQGLLRATVTSAHTLSDAQTSRMIGRLQDKFKKRIDIRAQLDPTLLGGFRVQVGDRIYDSSIETQLQSIHRKLMNA